MNFSWQNVETKYYLRFMMEKVLRSAMSIKIPFATIINNNCTKGQVACGGNQSAPTPQNEAQNNLADCQSTPFVRRQIFFFSFTTIFFLFSWSRFPSCRKSGQRKHTHKYHRSSHKRAHAECTKQKLFEAILNFQFAHLHIRFENSIFTQNLHDYSRMPQSSVEQLLSVRKTPNPHHTPEKSQQKKRKKNPIESKINPPSPRIGRNVFFFSFSGKQFLKIFCCENRETNI